MVAVVVVVMVVADDSDARKRTGTGITYRDEPLSGCCNTDNLDMIRGGQVVCARSACESLSRC